VNSFTYDAYKKMLFSILSRGYKLVGYHEVSDPPTCRIRHDVDVSLDRAQKMAQNENELQVKATYCVMVRSDAYNVFSKKNSGIIGSILEKGHFLGLHFDCAAYAPNTLLEEVAEECRVESLMLEKWFGVEVKLVSFHRPNALVLGGPPEISAPRPHAYERRFTREATYLSDSYGFWRFGDPLSHEAFKKGKSLSLNMHPVWWGKTSQSPLYLLSQLMGEKRCEMREYLLTNIVGV